MINNYFIFKILIIFPLITIVCYAIAHCNNESGGKCLCCSDSRTVSLDGLSCPDNCVAASGNKIYFYNFN